MEQTEGDFRDIERRRDMPPDELEEAFRSAEEPCEHPATRMIQVYRERREVCADCGDTIRTVIV